MTSMKAVMRVGAVVGALLLIVSSMVWAGPTAATTPPAEQEPNDTCATSQDAGTPALPFVLNGELTSTTPYPAPGTPGDVDFFRFSLTPGAAVQIDLQGSMSGNGTLTNPFLGLFAGDCSYVTYNDDVHYTTRDARLVRYVPADGTLVVAVSQCCDYSFETGGSGSYRLSVQETGVAASISGRLVNASPVRRSSVTGRTTHRYG